MLAWVLRARTRRHRLPPKRGRERNPTERKDGLTMDRFTAHFVGAWFGWQAWRRDDGSHCLHRHRSLLAAQRCADQCNKPTPAPGTPQGAWDHAAGYPD